MNAQAIVNAIRTGEFSREEFLTLIDALSGVVRTASVIDPVLVQVIGCLDAAAEEIEQAGEEERGKNAEYHAKEVKAEYGYEQRANLHFEAWEATR